MKLTLFDLDHTLLPLDSDHAWGVFTTAMGWNDAHWFNQRNRAYYAHYRAGTLDIHDYVRFATDAIRRQGAELSLAAHKRFMAEVIHPAILPQAIDLVQQHRQAGDHVLIVTATNEFITRPIAAALGVTGADLIAVNLERCPISGWLTGEIAGTPSFRAGKVARVKDWLAAHQLSWDNVLFIATRSTTCRCLSASPTPSPPTPMPCCAPWPLSVVGASLTCLTRNRHIDVGTQ